jgi:hypothetical protein
MGADFIVDSDGECRDCRPTGGGRNGPNFWPPPETVTGGNRPSTGKRSFWGSLGACVAMALAALAGGGRHGVLNPPQRFQDPPAVSETPRFQVPPFTPEHTHDTDPFDVSQFPMPPFGSKYSRSADDQPFDDDPSVFGSGTDRSRQFTFTQPTNPRRYFPIVPRPRSSGSGSPTRIMGGPRFASEGRQGE